MIKLYYTFSNPQSEAFIHSSLSCFTGKDNFSIKRSFGGKPHAEGVFFSLSHTDGLIACGVSEENIGVDCEKIRKINNKGKILERFLEQKYENITDEEFLKVWTAFESRVKYFGEKIINCPSLKNSDIYTTTFVLGDYVVSVSAKEKTEIIKENLYGSF